jgi:hypothetical protein
MILMPQPCDDGSKSREFLVPCDINALQIRRLRGLWVKKTAMWQRALRFSDLACLPSSHARQWSAWDGVGSAERQGKSS